jgi:hypothetical protein
VIVWAWVADVRAIVIITSASIATALRDALSVTPIEETPF